VYFVCIVCAYPDGSGQWQSLRVVEGHLNITAYMPTMYTHHKYNAPDVRSLLMSALLVSRRPLVKWVVGAKG